MVDKGECWLNPPFGGRHEIAPISCSERLPGVFSAEDIQARFGRAPLIPDPSGLMALPDSWSAGGL